MISVFSMSYALLIFSIVVGVVCVLLRSFPSLLQRGGAYLLWMIASFGALRLLLPFELGLTFLVRSWALLGTPVRILRTYPNITRLLKAVWIGGAIYVAFRDVRALRRAYKMSDAYVRVEDKRVQKVVEQCSIPYPVVVSPNVDVPYVEGIFRHTIYFPVVDFSELEIEFALRHEVQHIRNHDSIIKFCFRLILIAAWWNPLMHCFWRALDDLLELRCDAEMIEPLTAWERQACGKMLTSMSRAQVEKKQMSPLAVDELVAVGRQPLAKQRLDIVLNHKGKPPRSLSIVVFCISLVLFCASYLVIFQPAGMPEEKTFEEKTGVYYYEGHSGFDISDKVSNAFIFKGSDGQYELFIDYEFSGFLTEDEVNSGQYQNLFVFEEDNQE